MKEHPIIFKGEMVKAILDGRKTMTRRVIKPQPECCQMLRDGRLECSPDGGFDVGVSYVSCLYGQPGDRLWVRETFFSGAAAHNKILTKKKHLLFKADHLNHKGLTQHWQPSTFTPRWASRITLEITNIRAERVQEIGEADAIAEGIILKQGMGDAGLLKGYFPGNCDHATTSFNILWDSINAKRGYGWKLNPWVWVVSYKVVR